MSSGFEVKRDVKTEDAQVSVREINRKLAKLFHLPKYTKSFELKVVADEVPIIKCEYYPDFKDLAGVDLVTAEFELREITK